MLNICYFFGLNHVSNASENTSCDIIRLYRPSYFPTFPTFGTFFLLFLLARCVPGVRQACARRAPGVHVSGVRQVTSVRQVCARRARRALGCVPGVLRHITNLPRTNKVQTFWSKQRFQDGPGFEVSPKLTTVLGYLNRLCGIAT